MSNPIDALTLPRESDARRILDAAQTELRGGPSRGRKARKALEGKIARLEAHLADGCPLMTVRGQMRELHVYEHKVLLRATSRLSVLSGEKDIPLSSINAVQLKKPGFTGGYLHLTVSGEDAPAHDVISKAQHVNTVVLGKEQYEEAVKAKRIIEHYKQNPPAAGAAKSTDFVEMLEGLASLHQRGILTDTEYSEKKAEILGRM